LYRQSTLKESEIFLLLGQKSSKQSDFVKKSTHSLREVYYIDLDVG